MQCESHVRQERDRSIPGFWVSVPALPFAFTSETTVQPPVRQSDPDQPAIFRHPIPIRLTCPPPTDEDWKTADGGLSWASLNDNHSQKPVEAIQGKGHSL